MNRPGFIGVGIGLGIAGGGLISMFTGNLALWIAVGMVFGVGLGAALSKLSDRVAARASKEKGIAHVKTPPDQTRTAPPSGDR
jgi:hypothetical protein